MNRKEIPIGQSGSELPGPFIAEAQNGASELRDQVNDLRVSLQDKYLALQQSDTLLKLLIDSVIDYAIYMINADGIVVSWNAGACRIKGYEPQEIIGRHFSIFYSSEDRAAGLPAQGLEVAAREGRFEKEGWRYRKDGSRFWAHVVIDRILTEDGSLAGFAKVTRDMTERRETQIATENAREALLQSQKMEAIGQLTGGIAHDFNNLLMAVLGSLELLGRRLPDDPKLRLLLNNAFEGARRGAALTQRMLAFARRHDLALSMVDIGELLAGMADLLERSLGPLVTVEFKVPPHLPLIKADPNQLEAAILNLAVNSRDAMPRGGLIQILARRDCIQENNLGECIVLSVVDNGEGMDETTLRRATEPFYTTKEIGKGTGLGLSMVHGMAEQLGGRMHLKSGVGQGTIVELWLPVAEGKELPASVPPTAEIVERDDRQLSILVVDDDELVLTNTATMLEDAGHKIFAASSGTQALELIRKLRRVDLVITDQAMPQMTGMQLAAAIRVDTPDMPILLISGYAEMPAGGKIDIPKLLKPFTYEDLCKAVDLVASGNVTSDVLTSAYRGDPASD